MNPLIAKIIPVVLSLAVGIGSGAVSSSITTKIQMAEMHERMKGYERRTANLERDAEALRKRADEHDRQWAKFDKFMEDLKEVRADMKIVMRLQHEHSTRTVK